MPRSRASTCSALGYPTNVYVGPETVDLLQMRNYTDFFAIDTAVPIGTTRRCG